jgi:peptidoglycan/LPS O-acetylase OafA/YrhL
MIMSSASLNLSLQRIKRRDIQALRGISVLCVILFHLKPSFFPWGFLGVDIFFVISGFVMAPQLKKFIGVDRAQFLPTYRLYLLRRFWRLFPALSLTSMIFGFLVLLYSDIHEIGNTLRQLLLSMLGMANLGAYAISGDYFAPHGNAFLHNWSLSVEIQFYLLLPLVFFGLSWGARYFRSSFLPWVVFLVSITLFLGESYFFRFFFIFGSTGFLWDCLVLPSLYPCMGVYRWISSLGNSQRLDFNGEPQAR